MERIVRGSIHDVDMNGCSPSHYSLSRPDFEEQSFAGSDSAAVRLFGVCDKGYPQQQPRKSRTLTEFNEGFPRGNLTSSKFEWEQLLAKPKILGSVESYGTTATTTMSTARSFYDTNRFSISESRSIPLSAPRQLDVEVTRSSGHVNVCSYGLPSRRMPSGHHQMNEEFWIQNQAHLDKLSEGQVFENQASLEVYFKDAYVDTKPGYGSTLPKYQDAYENDGRLLSADGHGLKTDRSEMLAMTDHDSYLDGCDGRFERRLPPGDSLSNILKRKDGVSVADVQHVSVSKKAKCNVRHDENARKSSNETPCNRTTNFDSRDGNKCLGTNLYISVTSSSPNKQKPLVKLGPSPQNISAIDFSLDKQNHSVMKQLRPAPRNVKGGNFTQRIHDGVDGAHGREGDSSFLGKTVQLHVPPPQVKDQMLGKFTKVIQDGPDGTHSNGGDSSKCYTTPAKSEPRDAPLSQVKHQMPNKFAKRIQDGGSRKEGDSSNKGNATPAKTHVSPPRVIDQKAGAHGREGDSFFLGKTEQLHVPPPHVKDQMPGKFTKIIQDGPDGAAHNNDGDSSKCNTNPAKSEPRDAPLSQVKHQIPNKFTKRIQDGQDGASRKYGDSSNKGNANPAKTRVSPPRVMDQKAGKFTKRIQYVEPGAHSEEGDSTKGNAVPAKTKPLRAHPRAKNKNAGRLTRRLGDAPDGVHGKLDSSKGKVTPAKSESAHVASPEVKSQASGQLHPAPDAHDQSGDSLKGNLNCLRTEPPENSKDFNKRVHSAFLKFVKQLNENSAHWRNFMEQGRLKCNICGSKSEEFVDMEGLALHTFLSPIIEYRSLHLGFHKALCLMMGWKSAVSFNSLWVWETLPEAEASALKEDLIIWPPVAIIHNSSTQNNNPDERVVITPEMLEAVLKDKGFGGKIKVGRGRPGNQSIMVVKFSGTLSGLQQADRLHNFYAETKHGRLEFQSVTDRKSSTTWESHPPALKLENVLYGYLGIAEDLDKLDFETKKRSLVKSKKEIQNIADGL